jgi:hypothetical protein
MLLGNASEERYATGGALEPDGLFGFISVVTLVVDVVLSRLICSLDCGIGHRCHC